MCPQDIQPFPDMPVSECGSQASEERGQHPVSIVVVSPLHSFLSQIWRPHTKLHTPPACGESGITLPCLYPRECRD